MATAAPTETFEGSAVLDGGVAAMPVGDGLVDEVVTDGAPGADVSLTNANGDEVDDVAGVEVGEPVAAGVDVASGSASDALG